MNNYLRTISEFQQLAAECGFEFTPDEADEYFMAWVAAIHEIETILTYVEKQNPSIHPKILRKLINLTLED